MDIRDIERLTLDVMLNHGCHTAILYGSWARGQAKPQSDVDILYVREAGPAFRDARVVAGIYLDAFIYPEADLVTVEPQLLRVLGGNPATLHRFESAAQPHASDAAFAELVQAVYGPFEDDVVGPEVAC